MLRVSSVDTDHRGLAGAFQGKLHPAAYISVARGGGQAADHEVWIEVPYLLFEYVKFSGDYLRVRAHYLDTGSDHLPVGAIIVLQTHQYPQCDCSPAATPPLRTIS